MLTFEQKVSGLVLPACDGGVTLKKSWKLFSGNLDKDPSKEDRDLKVVGVQTPATSCAVLEYPNVQNLPIALGDPAPFAMTQHQVATFCSLHRQQLRGEGSFGTHFIVRNRERWQVVRVRQMFGFLYVLVYNLYNKANKPFQGETVWLVKPD
ncbi:MAG: hypothetical protein RLZZ480_574 [Candidatus Parcubacteria bacterium]|jgi:hypothetical protein